MTRTETSDLAIRLSSDDEQTRLRAIAQLAGGPSHRLLEAALDAAINCLGANRKVIQRRAAEALAAIAAHDGRILAKLRKGLKAPTERGRWGAAYALGIIEGALDLTAADALDEALGSPDGDIRWAAAELMVRLGRTNPAEVRERLLAAELTGNANARKMALYCLRDLGFEGKDVIALAMRAAKSEHSHVRLAALSLLGRLGERVDESSGIALELLRADGDERVRRAAASALGRLRDGSRAVRDALERAAHDQTDASLRKAAEQALRKLEGS